MWSKTQKASTLLTKPRFLSTCLKWFKADLGLFLWARRAFMTWVWVKTEFWEMGSDSESDSDSNSEVILSGLGFLGNWGLLRNCGCEQRDLGFNKERRINGGTGEEVIEDLIIIVRVLCVFRVVWYEQKPYLKPSCLVCLCTCHDQHSAVKKEQPCLCLVSMASLLSDFNSKWWWAGYSQQGKKGFDVGAQSSPPLGINRPAHIRKHLWFLFLFLFW